MIGAGLVRNFVGQVNTIKAAVLAALAGATGAGMVGEAESGTVQAALDSHKALIDAHLAKLAESILTADLDFGADPTGGLSCVAAFQAAMVELTARGGGRLRVRSGTYLFTLAGDADAIQIPSNVLIECEPGVVFRWGYWGAPLFAIVNKSRVRLQLNGARFVWAGNFGVTAGTLDKFGYGRAIPAYEWCAHIAIMGSQFVEVEGGRCEGASAANVLNCFVSARGTSVGDLTEGNQLRNMHADDVCQGAAWSEQKRFVVDIEGDRFSNASVALYGPGHLLYVTAGTTPSENGAIRIRDNAQVALSAFDGAGHSVSLKNLKHAKVDIVSRRPAGAVNMVDLEDVEIDVHWHSTATDQSSNGAIGMTAQPVVANRYVTIRGTLIFDAERNMPGFRSDSVVDGSKNLYCELDLTVVRTCDGSETLNAIQWVGNFGTCRLRHKNLGSGAARGLITVGSNSNDNTFHLVGGGTVPNPRVLIPAGSRNIVYVCGDATVDYDSNEFTPANGNAIVWQAARQYASQRSLGNVVNPAGTIQLPAPGAYDVFISIVSADGNHARSARYTVVYDDASANDYAIAQLVGAGFTKGGSAPTALALGVSNTGVLSVTSTAGVNTWNLKYGYRQLCAD